MLAYGFVFLAGASADGLVRNVLEGNEAHVVGSVIALVFNASCAVWEMRRTRRT